MPSDKGHINWKSIKDYHNGKLTGLEENRIEREAEKDPFFKEALEGYADRLDQSEINSDLKDIEKMVLHRSGQSSFDISKYRIVGLAASLIILISATLWIWTGLNRQSESLAEKQEEPQIEVTERSLETTQEKPLEEEIVLLEDEVSDEELIVEKKEEAVLAEVDESKKPDSGSGMDMMAMQSGSAYAQEESTELDEEISLDDSNDLAKAEMNQNNLNGLIDSIMMIDNAFVIEMENSVAANSSPAPGIAESSALEEEPKERKKRRSLFNRKDSRKAASESMVEGSSDLDLMADTQGEIEKNEELKRAMDAIKEGRKEDARLILSGFEARNSEQKRLIDKLLKLIE